MSPARARASSWTPWSHFCWSGRRPQVTRAYAMNVDGSIAMGALDVKEIRGLPGVPTLYLRRATPNRIKQWAIGSLVVAQPDPGGDRRTLGFPQCGTFPTSSQCREEAGRRSEVSAAVAQLEDIGLERAVHRGNRARGAHRWRRRAQWDRPTHHRDLHLLLRVVTVVVGPTTPEDRRQAALGSSLQTTRRGPPREHHRSWCGLAGWTLCGLEPGGLDG